MKRFLGYVLCVLMSKGPMMDVDQKHLIFDPLAVPFAGLKSKPTPLALHPGEFSAAQNWRSEDFALTVRNPHIAMTAAVSGGTPRGLWGGSLNGTDYIVSAWRVGSETKLYTYSSGALTEITAASGKYGNTRFATDGDCGFAPVTDRIAKKDLLVIQNGSDYPRVWDPSGSTVAVHQDITPPLNTSLSNVVASMYTFMSVATTGAPRPTYTNSGAQFTGADATAAPNQNIRLTCTAAAAVNDTIGIFFNQGALPDFSVSRQLVIIAGSAWANWLQSVKIQMVYSGGGSTTIWDGTDSSYSYFYTPLNTTTNIGLYAFSLDNFPATQSITDSLIFTLKTAPVATSTVDIYAVMGSGQLPAGIAYGISYANKGSRAESPGTVLPSAKGEFLSNLGCASLNSATLPVVSGIYYQYTLRYKTVSQTLANLGVDRLYIFRQDAPETAFYYLSAAVVSSWNGAAWVITAAAPWTDYPVGGATGGWKSLKTTEYRMPGGYQKAIPKGSAMVSANGRLLVGNIGGDLPGRLFLSEYESPFHFQVSPVSEVVPPQDQLIVLPTSMVFEGEVIQAIIPVPTTVVGVNTIYIFTNKGVYAINGLDTYTLSRRTRIESRGTVAPKSVCSYHEWMYFLDTENQIRRIGNGYGMRVISRFLIDDKLSAIPASRLSSVKMAFYKDRLYIAYTLAAGSTNTKILVYNLWQGQASQQDAGMAWTGRWESDDLLPAPFTAEHIAPVIDASTSKFFALSSDGKVYEMEQNTAGGDLGGSTIAVLLTTGDIHFPVEGAIASWGEFTLGRDFALCDDASSAVLSSTRTFKPNAGSNTASLSMTGTGTAWRTGANPVGSATGAAAQIAYSANLPAGKKIYTLGVEVRHLDGSPNVN